jgi:uracil phosphoribosyltransferase
MSAVHVSAHPVVLHQLAALRSTTTSVADFRQLVRRLSLMLALEATSDLETMACEVETPLTMAKCRRIAGRVALVPVLRAGLGMAEGVLELMPEAEVWHVGLYRDEATLEPKEYYNKLPQPNRADLALVLDPMLATGGSAARACEIVRAAGVRAIRFVGLIAAPEGVARLSSQFPDVAIHIAAIDDRLNEHGFIVPGLGDAGDRQFGT